MTTMHSDPIVTDITAVRAAAVAAEKSATNQAVLMGSLRTLASHSASREAVLADAARISAILADMRRATTMRAAAVTSITPALRPVAATLPPVA